MVIVNLYTTKFAYNTKEVKKVKLVTTSKTFTYLRFKLYKMSLLCLV